MCCGRTEDRLCFKRCAKRDSMIKIAKEKHVLIIIFLYNFFFPLRGMDHDEPLVLWMERRDSLCFKSCAKQVLMVEVAKEGGAKEIT